jgi:uncharacterized membrane protein YphA (DoxX/SURF4 family)
LEVAETIPIMIDQKFQQRLSWLLTILNLAIGWHLLYEGLTKLFNPEWSAASYLSNASGPFSSLFKALAANPFMLNLADWFNIAGLIVIGLALITGIYTRLAARAGVLLLALYYLANPPLAATSTGFGQEGHYLIVNKTLIEALALLFISIVPSNWYYGLVHLMPKFQTKKLVPVEVPAEVNHNLEQKILNRRNLMKNLISLPVLGGFAFAFAKNHGWSSFEENHLSSAGKVDVKSGATAKIAEEVGLDKLVKKIPVGKIGNFEMSRLICGGNLISGYAHSRDLIYVSTFLKKYFTNQKVMETFWLCEQCGIDTTAVGVGPNEIAMLQQYWKDGGKMKWLAPVYPSETNFRENIDLAIDNGAGAVMILGNLGDEWVRDGKFDLIHQVIEYSKGKGVPAGVACHELQTVKAIEEHGIATDFYMKTLHSKKYWSWQPDEVKEKMIIENYEVDNYWSRFQEETIAYMESLDKPWIAFKVLAAGAIHPKEGFRYAFESGADFACVGMFDFQVVENANCFNEIMADPGFVRVRKWLA